MIKSQTILCLGAGLVTAPGIQYLAESGFHITVASRTLSKAEKVIEGLPNCKAAELDVHKDPELLEQLVQSHDLVISLLPWVDHPIPIRLALKHKKNFCTTSYISDFMLSLDADFRAAGVVAFNECGVDPGMDHMSAMRIIHQVHKEGGQVLEFRSYCGGLPCPDDNNNPFGYKFSWSPRGVLLAATRPALYLLDGEQKRLDGTPGNQIYDVCYHDSSVPNVGPKLETEWPAEFECYPNGDSCKYVEIYDIPEVKTLIRGTYRNVGWCPTMKRIQELGLMKEDNISEFKGKSYAELLAAKLGCEAAQVKATAAAKVGLHEDDPIVGRMEWLGLFDEAKKVEALSTLDALCELFLKNPKLWYEPGERDMLVMHHTFIIQKADGSKEKLTSTLCDYGSKDGVTSMSRLVSLPMAIMVRRILQGEVKLSGVLRPTSPETYNPILDEMKEKYGIEFVEVVQPI